MSLLTFVILGFAAGFVASKLVHKPGEGLLPDLVLGTAGALAGGWVLHASGLPGATGSVPYNVMAAIAGAFVLVRGISYPSNHNMMRIGNFQASVQYDRAVPQWAGIAAVLGGALMIGVSLRGRKS